VRKGRDTVPHDICLDAEAERIMVRVRAVLDPQNTGDISAAQRRLFESTSAQMVEFGAERKNPIVSVVDHIGNYWRNWLLVILNTGSYRPSKISRILEALDPSHPISQRMLTLNLRLLERDGLIERSVICAYTNHVEYGLTALGSQLAGKLMSLIEWIGDHAGEIAHARAAFDAASDLD
jgi:DNA-binding HxlR family transcriptional regulator